MPVETFTYAKRHQIEDRQKELQSHTFWIWLPKNCYIRRILYVHFLNHYITLISVRIIQIVKSKHQIIKVIIKIELIVANIYPILTPTTWVNKYFKSAYKVHLKFHIIIRLSVTHVHSDHIKNYSYFLRHLKMCRPYFCSYTTNIKI